MILFCFEMPCDAVGPSVRKCYVRRIAMLCLV